VSHPLDYETPRPLKTPHPSARRFWPDWQPVAEPMLSFFVAGVLTWVVWYVARWPWWIMVPLFTALVVAAEWFAVGIERRNG
jgi:hypothetical protein